jgi:acyl-CoA hydrolase
MEVGIKVVAENIRERSMRHVNSCFFTMVAMGDDGRPTPVPPLEPQTEDELQRFRKGEQRRALRAENAKRLAEIKSGS